MDKVLDMDYSSNIETLLEEFAQNPLNFTLESELQYRLKNIIQNEISDDGVKISDTDATYSADKHRKFISSAKEKVEKIDKVHCEVYIDEMDGHVDLAVFKDNIEISIDKGTKHFSEEDLETAIEMKFVKNRDYATNFDKMKTDIQDRLDKLPKDVEKHFVVIANKDIFRHSGQTDWSKKEEELETMSEEVKFHYKNIPIDN